MELIKLTTTIAKEKKYCSVMVPKSLSVCSYATSENWPNFYQLSYKATGKQSLAWSQVKE